MVQSHVRDARSARERVPPGQHLASRLPVLHYGTVPQVNLALWELKVFGLVAKPLRLSYDEVRALPSRRIQADIHCVTTWSVLDTAWEGVPFEEIIARAELLPSALFVMAHGEGGYSTSIPLERLRSDDVLLAYRYDDEELTPAHGYPLRLLVPALYFWKSAKWLRGLEFLAEDRLGFWEQRGYNNAADPWKEERFAF